MDISVDTNMVTNNVSNCRKDNWNQQDEFMINKQINVELHAAHIYNSLYCHFKSDSIGFPGTAEFFKKSSDEENEHARKFMEYQNTRGGKVVLENIEKPVFEFDQNINKSLLYQAFNYALETEQKVYESIAGSLGDMLGNFDIQVNIEMDPDEDIVSVQKEYIRLAETLWNGTEALAPAPLPDRDIFELLGFD